MSSALAAAIRDARDAGTAHGRRRRSGDRWSATLVVAALAMALVVAGPPATADAVEGGVAFTEVG